MLDSCIELKAEHCGRQSNAQVGREVLGLGPNTVWWSVYNILAALTTALALKFDVEKSLRVLEKIPGVAGRFEIVVNKPLVIVDYALTPDGL